MLNKLLNDLKNGFYDAWAEGDIMDDKPEITTEEIKSIVYDFLSCRLIEQEEEPLQAINDHLNAIADILADSSNTFNKDFITAILRHVKGVKAVIRKEVIK